MSIAVINHATKIKFVSLHVTTTSSPTNAPGPFHAAVRFRIPQVDGEDAYLVEHLHIAPLTHTLDELISTAKKQMAKRFSTIAQWLDNSDPSNHLMA